MGNHVLPRFNTCYQSVSKTLEDIRLLLGLDQEELVSALSLLERADHGSLYFTQGNTQIRFQSSPSLHSMYSDISVDVEVREEEVKHTVEYHIPRSVLSFLKRAKNRSQSIIKANKR
jgi:hypothetical protein